MPLRMLSVVALVVALAGCSEGFQRDVKTAVSEYTGGLKRVATVYAADGSVIARYEGKFDVQSSEYGNKVLFDVDGRRIIIYNATVVIEER